MDNEKDKTMYGVAELPAKPVAFAYLPESSVKASDIASGAAEFWRIGEDGTKWYRVRSEATK